VLSKIHLARDEAIRDLPTERKDRIANLLLRMNNVENGEWLNIQAGDAPYSYFGLKEISFNKEKEEEIYAVCQLAVTFLRLHFYGSQPDTGHKQRFAGINIACDLVLKKKTVSYKSHQLKNLWKKYKHISHIIAAWHGVLVMLREDNKSFTDGNAYDLFNNLHAWFSGAKAIKNVMLDMLNPSNTASKKVFTDSAFVLIPQYSHTCKEQLPQSSIVDPFTDEEWKILDNYEGRDKSHQR
jgi:hypothetical protein